MSAQAIFGVRSLGRKTAPVSAVVSVVLQWFVPLYFAFPAIVPACQTGTKHLVY
jgi:hypothetical protein